MKTRQELIAAVLDLLGKGAAGQDPAPEDVQKIDGLINGKVKELNERRILLFNNTQQFEDQYLDPLSVIIANMAAPSFLQPRNPEREANAIAILYAMQPSTYVSGSVQEATYY